MCLGTIEKFLSGELLLLEDSFDIPDAMLPIRMTEIQK